MIKRILLWSMSALLLVLAGTVALNWDVVRRVFLGGLHTHETVPPALAARLNRPAILVFSKTNAYRHEDAIPAGNRLLQRIAQEHGWGYFQTENGAAFTPAILARFDAVVFNNVSGDVFSSDQQAAFRKFLEGGGGFVGLHAAGDGSHQAWAWYTDNIIGAHFTMHTLNPQFQSATVRVEDPGHPAMAGLPGQWQRTEEWYSFDRSPRGRGFHVLASVDERSYRPEGLFGQNLRMGADHPAIWMHCIGRGRVLYSIFGHRAEAFSEPETVRFLNNGLGWAARQLGSECDAPAGTVGKAG